MSPRTTCSSSASKLKITARRTSTTSPRCSSRRSSASGQTTPRSVRSYVIYRFKLKHLRAWSGIWRAKRKPCMMEVTVKEKFFCNMSFLHMSFPSFVWTSRLMPHYSCTQINCKKRFHCRCLQPADSICIFTDTRRGGEAG